MKTAPIAVAALLALGGAAGFAWLAQPTPPRQCPGGITGADIGGPFALTDQAGDRVTSDDLKGKPLLMYFGYATCPDICPTELADVAAAVDILAEQHGISATPVFITTDPERDTPERLTEFVPFFHDEMIGLTGSLEEIDKVAKAYRVYYRKAPDPDFPDGYAMDHSSFIYLVGADGAFITYFKYEDGPELIAEGTACHTNA